MTADEPSLAADLRDALRPLWRELNAHRPVSLVRVGALSRLARTGAATAADLAGHEHVTPQAMTTVVREFENDGLVTRTPDTEDRRRVWVEITDAGRVRLEEYLSAGNAWLEQALSERLLADERAQLAAALPLLRKLVGEEHE